MTGAELKTFVEEGLDTGTINETWFYQALNVAKTKLEEIRNWKILEKVDASKTALSSDTFLTTKALPTRFALDIELFVIDSTGASPIYYTPIPSSRKYLYQNSSNVYYVDLANNVFALCGKVNGSKIINLVYKESSADIDESSSWSFPSRFHPILGFMVGEMYRGGSDWDKINAQNLIQNRKDAMDLYDAMVAWDDSLKARELSNQYERTQSFDNDGFAMGDQTGFDLGRL